MAVASILTLSRCEIVFSWETVTVSRLFCSPKRIVKEQNLPVLAWCQLSSLSSDFSPHFFLSNVCSANKCVFRALWSPQSFILSQVSWERGKISPFLLSLSSRHGIRNCEWFQRPVPSVSSSEVLRLTILNPYVKYVTAWISKPGKAGLIGDRFPQLPSHQGLGWSS